MDADENKTLIRVHPRSSAANPVFFRNPRKSTKKVIIVLSETRQAVPIPEQSIELTRCLRLVF
jgi:hypothetical protein